MSARGRGAEPGPEAERIYQPKVDRVVLARLLGYARPFRGHIAVSVVLLLLVSAGELLFPLLARRAIDVHVAAGDVAGLGRLSILYLALLLAVFALRHFQLTLTASTGQRIIRDLRGAIFSHLQRLDHAWFARNPVGRVMTRLTGDVETLNELFSAGLVSIFGDVLTLLGIATALLWLNWRLALITMIVIPLLLAASLIFRAKVRHAFAQIRVRVAALNAFMQESITGMPVVQLFTAEPWRRRKFVERNLAHRDAFLKSVFYFAVYFPVVEFLEVLALALILYHGGGESLRGALTLGSLVAFIQYSERFFRPIRDLADRYNILQSAMASSERIFELLDTLPAIVSPETSPDAVVTASPSSARHEVISGQASSTRSSSVQSSSAQVSSAEVSPARSSSAQVGSAEVSPARSSSAQAGSAPFSSPQRRTVQPAALEFCDVRFSYKPGEEILRGVSFRIEDGESVALVGHTGAGKTTILNLLVRFHDVDSGRILVRGRDVRQWNLGELRRQVGAVPQETFLWNESVRRNVALKQNRPAEEIDRVLRLVGLYPNVLAGAGSVQAGDNLEEPVGERGTRLSAGQRQLVSFARALLVDPPILVLDEATSYVDTETEQRIQAALLTLLGGRTSLVIAHRLSTIRHVDRVLVLHRGRLVEEGTHDDLLRLGGIYARYYELEYLRQGVDPDAGEKPEPVQSAGAE